LTGGGLYATAKTQSNINTAQWITTGGLMVQVISFGFFMLVALLFHRRLAAQPTTASQQVPWRRCLYTLYATSLLILIRSVFRVVEFATGFDGPVQSSEAYIYVFDATLIFLVCVIFNVSHPAAILKAKRGNSGGEYDDLEGQHGDVVPLENAGYSKGAAISSSDEAAARSHARR
jgi:hypothetical protein